MQRYQQKDDYVVVDCPDGTFKKGAFFHYYEFQETKKLGNFPPGLVLDRRGERYAIVGDELTKQELRRLEA